MHHFRRHEVKSAGIEIELLAVARERRHADDHRVRFIGGVPMLAHVDRFRRANQQTGRVRLWINTQNTNLGRIFAQIRQNFVPFSFRQILDLWRI